MTDFVATAEALRIVKKAQQKFLALWALECLMNDRKVFDRIALDADLRDDRRRRAEQEPDGDYGDKG